ncbi:MAG: N-acetylmuramoyl-L-alanine amidase [Clostridiales bacterium]|nr:N-acetylmuramoyl-L-alanine amidase [Clostridiales bacterium]
MKLIFFRSVLLLTIFSFVLGACGDSPDSSQGIVPDTTLVWETPAVTDKESEEPKGRILIDPGHGFEDPGCTAYDGSFTEAQITEKMAVMLQQELISRGWEAELTHDGKHMPDAALLYASAQQMPLRNDVNVNPQEWVCDNAVFSKYERVLYANACNREKPVTLLLSLHVNSIETSAQTVRGFEIDYYKDHPDAAIAGSFCEILKKALRDTFNQKIRLFADNAEEAFVVTKYTDMPSVLLEMGYASNAKDAALLTSAQFQTQLTQSIADAIDNTF